MTRRLRVLFYIGSMHAGGAERQVVEMLRHLNRERFEPMLALASREGSLLSEVPADVPLLAFADPDTGRQPWSRWGVGFLRRSRWLSRLLRTQRCDVVYDRTYLATLDTAWACWSRGVPRISAAVADPRVQFEMYARRLPALRRRYGKWTYHTAAKVLANSAGLQQQMIDYWQLPPEQVLVQPNGLDFERIEQRSREQTIPKNPGEIRLLTVGRIDEDKGHIDLLNALEELVRRRGHRELKWQILGVGPCMETLRQEVAAKGLTSHVEFVGA
ncbi:MAG TPA: glycosyltransferase, partial [Planctomycetaceae bacterium]|nr:glycosyltransferase [Planctomycetaceae bacterium]